MTSIDRSSSQVNFPEFTFNKKRVESEADKKIRLRETKSRYTQSAVLCRFKCYLQREASVLTPKQVRNIKARAARLTRFLKAEECTSDQLTKRLFYRQISQKQEGLPIGKNELFAKIYSLSLRLEILFLQYRLTVLPSQISSKTGRIKMAPHIRLFGEQASAESLDTTDGRKHLIFCSKIDEGSYNIALKAFDMDSGLVVSRELKKKSLSNPMTIKKWEKEVEAHLVFLKNIPGVIRIHAVFESQASKRKGLLMEYADGNLKELFYQSDHKTRLLNASQRKKIMLQLLTTLEALHATGQAHADLTPGNVLFRRLPRAKYEIKLADFGFLQPAPCKNYRIGTPEYIPPEAFYLGSLDLPSPSMDTFGAALIAHGLKSGAFLRNRKPATRIRQLNSLYRKDKETFKEFVKLEYPKIWDESASLEAIYNKIIKETIHPELEASFEPLRAYLRKSDDLYDKMILKLIRADPRKRWTATRAREFLARVKV